MSISATGHAASFASTQRWLLLVSAAIIVFPLSYIVGDVLTEVYGYRVARRVIWTGFMANVILVVFIYLAQLLPPPASGRRTRLRTRRSSGSRAGCWWRRSPGTWSGNSATRSSWRN